LHPQNTPNTMEGKRQVRKTLHTHLPSPTTIHHPQCASGHHGKPPSLPGAKDPFPEPTFRAKVGHNHAGSGPLYYAQPWGPPSPHTPLWAYITGSTKLPLAILDLGREFLQEGLLDSPDGWRLTPCLQRQLRRKHATRPARSALFPALACLTIPLEKR
jgi:hypothetical protein